MNVVSLDEHKREPAVQWLNRTETVLWTAVDEVDRLRREPRNLTCHAMLTAALKLVRCARFLLVQRDGLFAAEWQEAIRCQAEARSMGDSL